MGIDAHALNFIRYAAKDRPLGRVATMGRQALAIARLQAQFGRYCENFLMQEMGAEIVASYDFSDYEGATHIADMNKPLERVTQYETVIDCGTLEHIFNVPQALKNVSSLCKTGGQIVHVLPANNFCGHGFWQFSSELFFSLYATKNGYRETQVFLADVRNDHLWYEVVPPTEGRVNVTSTGPVYVMCRTVKQSEPAHGDIQQSDYVQRWDEDIAPGRNGIAAGVKALVSQSRWLHGASLALHHAIRARFERMRNPTRLSGRHPHLKQRRVRALLNC